MSLVNFKICNIILPFLAIFLVSYVHADPKIVEPYPDNVYAIENEKTQVTCVVEDTDSNPDKILFVRKSRFGDITPIYDEGPDGRIYYQNETLDGGSKLRVTLHFNKVVRFDDSRNGGYECQGFTGSKKHEYGFTVTVIERDPRIVEPYPDNIYAIENEKTKVTCVVEDTDSNPDKIVFVRKSRFGDITPIYDEGPDGRIYYQNETLGNGSKLRVTLHFNKVVRADDSMNGGYECKGFTGSKKQEYGFTVTVIEREELPGIDVSKNVSAKFGDQIVLSCNLTIKKGGSADQTKLTKLMWAKEGKLIEELLYPREQSLKTLKIDIDSPERGGIYTCHLTSKLRNVKDYNVTDNIYVSVKPKFFTADLKDNQVIVNEGDATAIVCSAQGNPLQTQWKVKSDSSKEDPKFIAMGNSSIFSVSNEDKLKDHTLKISQVDYSNRGKYYCCIKDVNNNRRAEGDVEGCQVFTLSVKSSSANRNSFNILSILLGLFVGLLNM